jgi:hypothetical protein
MSSPETISVDEREVARRIVDRQEAEYKPDGHISHDFRLPDAGH